MNRKQQKLAKMAYQVVDGKLSFAEYRVAEQKFLAGLKQ